MTEMMVCGPLEELDVRNELRLQPAALRHLGFRQALSPPAASLFRQVGERAVRSLESLKPREQLLTHRRRKAVACSRHVHQPVTFVESKYHRIEHSRTDRVAADNELLTSVDAHFQPGPR